MEDHSRWGGKLALICYFALVCGILMGSIIVELILFGMEIDYIDLSFPIAFISLPINDAIILAITLLFAKYKGAGLKELGLKKISFRILMIVLVVAVPLFLVGLGISIGQEIIFGPDPIGRLVENVVMPRNTFQLIAMIALFLVITGPCEELAFRGFVQRGFESSFGKVKGLLLTSILFGVTHGLNTLYAIIPAFVGGVILGYIWQKTGTNTIASALLHGINNTISITIAYLFVT